MIDMDSVDIDLPTWFSERRVSYKPEHFVVTNTPITQETNNWIFSKTKGRFAFVTMSTDENVYQLFPAFEDPQEAVLYELTWS